MLFIGCVTIKYEDAAPLHTLSDCLPYGGNYTKLGYMDAECYIPNKVLQQALGVDYGTVQ